MQCVHDNFFLTQWTMDWKLDYLGISASTVEYQVWVDRCPDCPPPLKA